MSWDEYIDRVIAASDNHASSVCIIGLDGVKWTSDNHRCALALTPAEAKKIAEDMVDETHNNMLANGIRVKNCKFKCVRADEKMAFFKQKDEGGVAMQRTKKAVVIAHFPEGKQAGNVSKGVGAIADYLEGNGM